MDSVGLVGYSQDHEGYLLVTEDWLKGGYEPSINCWGPLQADYLMDQAMDMSGLLLTDEIEPHDPWGIWSADTWGPYSLPVHTPDLTPEAGTLLEEPPDYLYSPLLSNDELDEGVVPDLSWPDQVPRVQGIVQIAWQGGDPAVDLPRVLLERSEEDGLWAEVTTASGRAVTEALPDILLAHTPDPLEPADADQDHFWWAAWQAISTVRDRAGFPEGRYRLHVYGNRATGGSTWPFQTEPYEFTTEPFTVVVAALDVTITDDDMCVSLPGPQRGFRHVARYGSYRGDNPVPENTVQVTWTMSDGSFQTEDLLGSVSSQKSCFEDVVPSDAIEAVVRDVYGNEGSWSSWEPSGKTLHDVQQGQAL